MRMVTFTFEDGLIEAAEERARKENTTVDEQMRNWLESYAGQIQRAKEAMAVVSELQGRLHTGGERFTRDQMNGR